MGALKANILSWAWAVLILLNPVEVGVFSLAEALPINIGYVDCSLQINAAQTIPLKPWLQHSLTTHNICQVTQVSTQPAWFPSYFTPGLLFPDYPYCSRAAFGRRDFGRLFLSERRCWHSWQASLLSADHTGCVPPGSACSLWQTFSTIPESPEIRSRQCSYQKCFVTWQNRNYLPSNLNLKNFYLEHSACMYSSTCLVSGVPTWTCDP